MTLTFQATMAATINYKVSCLLRTRIPGILGKFIPTSFDFFFLLPIDHGHGQVNDVYISRKLPTLLYDMTLYTSVVKSILFYLL